MPVAGQDDGQTPNPLEENIDSQPEEGGAPEATDSESSDTGTPAEEDVFEVDLIPLSGSEDGANNHAVTEPAIPVNHMSINTKVTKDGKLLIEPVFGPGIEVVQNHPALKKAKKKPMTPAPAQQKAPPLKQVLDSESSMIPVGDRKVRRIRRIYRVPAGQSVKLGTFNQRTADGRIIKITRRLHPFGSMPIPTLAPLTIHV